MKKNVLSYGLSSYGYDARVSGHFNFTNVNSATVDPKKFSKSQSFVDRRLITALSPPNSFALAKTVGLKFDVGCLCW